METLSRGPGPGRNAVDVRHHVYYRWLAGGHGLVEGALNLAGMVHPNAEAAHVLGELGKVGVRKHPQLLHVARLAPIVALVAPLFLVQRVVVVDDGHGVDAIPHRRLQLPQVVPEATVAGETHHGPVGQGTLDPHGGREGPAQGPSTPDERLIGVLGVYHGAGPDAGMARIG